MKKRLSLLMIFFLISLLPLLVYGEGSGERLLPRLVDEANLLTIDEVSKLTQKLDEVSERNKLDVVIVTVKSLEGKSPEDFADDTFDYNGFGMGENYDGILLLISMEERDWAVSTHGYAITVFTDAGQQYIEDNFIEYLSEGKYYEAFNKFADLSDEFIIQAKTNIPYDIDNLPKKPMSPVWILISIIGGVVIGFIGTGIMKSNLKSVSKQRVATKYLVNTSMSPFSNKDLYLYSTVTKTKKQKESNNTKSSGGSSTHTSSSGRTHGGSSGKF